HSFQSPKSEGRISTNSLSHVKNKALYYPYGSATNLFSTSSGSHTQLFDNSISRFQGTHTGEGQYSLIMVNDHFYSTDGTKEGTFDLLKSEKLDGWLTDAIYTESNDIFYFLVNGQVKCEIYETDGTREGTILMGEILPTYPDSVASVYFLKDIDQSLYIALSLIETARIFRISKEDKNL